MWSRLEEEIGSEEQRTKRLEKSRRGQCPEVNNKRPKKNPRRHRPGTSRCQMCKTIQFQVSLFCHALCTSWKDNPNWSFQSHRRQLDILYKWVPQPVSNPISQIVRVVKAMPKFWKKILGHSIWHQIQIQLVNKFYLPLIVIVAIKFPIKSHIYSLNFIFFKCVDYTSLVFVNLKFRRLYFSLN